jgi:hypothetical protein
MKTPQGQSALLAVANAIDVYNNTIIINDDQGSFTWQRERASPIKDRLTQAIYTNCYTGIGRSYSHERDFHQSTDEWIGNKIINAINLPSYCDWTWIISSFENHGSVEAHREGWTSTFEPGGYLTKTGIAELKPGDLLGIVSPIVMFDRVSRSILTRFRLFGSALLAQEIRVYLNVDPLILPNLIHLITEKLSLWNIPFALKSPAFKSLYTRRDAIVIYLDRSDCEVAVHLLLHLSEPYKHYFREETPLFTYPLGPGIGFAESPTDGSSFGIARSKVCASAILRATETKSSAERLKSLQAEFERVGLSIDEPYVNPGTYFPYRFRALAQKACS